MISTPKKLIWNLIYTKDTTPRRLRFFQTLSPPLGKFILQPAHLKGKYSPLRVVLLETGEYTARWRFPNSISWLNGLWENAPCTFGITNGLCWCNIKYTTMHVTLFSTPAIFCASPPNALLHSIYPRDTEHLGLSPILTSNPESVHPLNVSPGKVTILLNKLQLFHHIRTAIQPHCREAPIDLSLHRGAS